MEPALKQRVVGAAVLVALAVIFLPMLVKGPAPASGISDVPLELPEAPQGEFETRELPLVTPGAAPTSGVVGMEAGDGDDAAEVAASAGPAPLANEGLLPAATAGGDYAVSFGRYATAADADRVVAALRDAQLPGFQEAMTDNGRTLYRVRVGPYATRANAEAARLRAVQVRDDVGAKVVVLDAQPATPAAEAGPEALAATADKPDPAHPVSTPRAAPSSQPPEPVPARMKAEPTRTTAASTSQPAAKPDPKPAPKPAPRPADTGRPAAASTGYAVQLGAFGNVAEATRLRDRARAAGLQAFMESVHTDKGVLRRVSVGPALTRADADQLKAQVVARLGIGDAIVRPHP